MQGILRRYSREKYKSNTSIYPKSTKSSDYSLIKSSLLTYTETLLAATGTNNKTTKRGYIDEWYDSNGKIATDEGVSLSDTTGCGLTYEKYKENYEKMLKSIFENGGFWIARYEAGIDGTDLETNYTDNGTSSLVRSSHTDITTASPKIVSKPNCIPYTFIFCSEAQSLANSELTNMEKEYQRSLMFGVQWDLALKYLENKGVSKSYLTNNSGSWGNYRNAQFELNSGRYAKYDAYTKWHPYTEQLESVVGLISEKNTKLSASSSSNSALLTTGASEINKKQNIYDFAGNVYEFTLEHATTSTRTPCSMRGGSFMEDKSNTPASFRDGYYATSAYSKGIGFRVCIY